MELALFGAGAPVEAGGADEANGSKLNADMVSMSTAPPPVQTDSARSKNAVMDSIVPYACKYTVWCGVVLPALAISIYQRLFYGACIVACVPY